MIGPMACSRTRSPKTRKSNCESNRRQDECRDYSGRMLKSIALAALLLGFACAPQPREPTAPSDILCTVEDGRTGSHIRCSNGVHAFVHHREDGSWREFGCFWTLSDEDACTEYGACGDE
jgi:hypothetical protein